MKTASYPVSYLVQADWIIRKMRLTKNELYTALIVLVAVKS